MAQPHSTELPEPTRQQLEKRELDQAYAQTFQADIPPVHRLQRALGNRSVTRLILARQLGADGTFIDVQKKLTVGAADDQYEQEADRVARLVMNTSDATIEPTLQRGMPSEEAKDKMLQTKPLAAFITPYVQREMVRDADPEENEAPIQARMLSGTNSKSLQRQPEAEEDEQEPVQAKPTESMASSFDAGADVETRLSQSKGHGSPLPDPVRAFMEPRFGVDFSHVRIHTGNHALEMNRAIGAQAFTHGSDIYYGEGSSPSQLELTAHELTHVVQQTGNTHLRTNKLETKPAAADTTLHRMCPACAEEEKQSTAYPSRLNRMASIQRTRATKASICSEALLPVTTPNSYHRNTNEKSFDRTSTPLSIDSSMKHCQSITTQLQRAASDFQIRDIAPEDTANPDMLFFKMNSSSLVASEQAKIPALAMPPGRNLTLNGFSSEEGSDADNDKLIQERLKKVESALIAAGHTGIRALVNLRTSGVGQINYRHQRSVEVLPTPVGLPAAPSQQSNCSLPGAINAPCGTAFSLAYPIALAAVLLSKIRLANPADAMANALLSRLFAGVPRATVEANMNALFLQVLALPSQHQCHSDCDAGCGRPAYQSGTGVGPGGAMMTLCPDFLNGTDLMFNAQTLVHESAHGTSGLSAEDIAYHNTRQITFLSPADAVRNTDSYVLLAFELTYPGTMSIGPATPDTVAGMTPAEENSARQALAWLESWLNYGDFDTEILYDTVNRSIPPAPAWDTSHSGDPFNIDTMHLIAPVFGLTDPGPAAPFVQPTKTDKVKIAAIHDRYDQMYGAINQQTLNASKGAAGSGSWQSHGAALPRLGQNIVLAPAFFAMSPVAQVKDLVLLMATAMSGISSGFRQKYVDAMDLIRTHRGLGP